MNATKTGFVLTYSDRNVFLNGILSLLSEPTAWVALVTLLVMEVVLGIDNLLFVSILTNKLPLAHRARARRLGIGLALVLRLALLGTISWIIGLNEPVLSALGQTLTWRDLILIAGGLFLVWKATKEIHDTMERSTDPGSFESVGGVGEVGVTLGGTIIQIILLDMVFSIDSVLTAIGMTEHVPIMVVAVVIAVAVMMLAAAPLAAFVHNNPGVVMLVLGFLLMIGMVLIADGLGAHVPKGYIYAAMGFSALIEALNIASRSRRKRRHAVSV